MNKYIIADSLAYLIIAIILMLATSRYFQFSRKHREKSQLFIVRREYNTKELSNE